MTVGSFTPCRGQATYFFLVARSGSFFPFVSLSHSFTFFSPPRAFLPAGVCAQRSCAFDLYGMVAPVVPATVPRWLGESWNADPVHRHDTDRGRAPSAPPGGANGA